MRFIAILSSLLLSVAIPAYAQVRVGINIGVNVPVFPQLVLVPGYPVYYDPSLDSNYFFYDGQYWVFVDDNWYVSDWFDGPWDFVDPAFVPLYVLRVPVQYYRRPPIYFRAWQRDAPPHWGEHWGRDWENRRAGWDRWDRNSRPSPAPLPVYQRQFSGDRYPRAVDQQRSIRTQNYRYQPRDPLVKQRFDNPARNRPGDMPANNARTNGTNSPAAPPSPDRRGNSQPAAPPRPPTSVNAPDRSQHNESDRRLNSPRSVQPPPRQDAPSPVAPRPQSVTPRPPGAEVNRPEINRGADRRENSAPATKQNHQPTHQPNYQPEQHPHDQPRGPSREQSGERPDKRRDERR